MYKKPILCAKVRKLFDYQELFTNFAPEFRQVSGSQSPFSIGQDSLVASVFGRILHPINGWEGEFSLLH